MNQEEEKDTKDLDQELVTLRHLIEKENDMLRRMISSLDSLEKKIIQSGKRKSSEENL